MLDRTKKQRERPYACKWANKRDDCNSHNPQQLTGYVFAHVHISHEYNIYKVGPI